MNALLCYKAVGPMVVQQFTRLRPDSSTDFRVSSCSTQSSTPLETGPASADPFVTDTTHRFLTPYHNNTKLRIVGRSVASCDSYIDGKWRLLQCDCFVWLIGGMQIVSDLRYNVQVCNSRSVWKRSEVK